MILLPLETSISTTVDAAIVLLAVLAIRRPPTSALNTFSLRSFNALRETNSAMNKAMHQKEYARKDPSHGPTTLPGQLKDNKVAKTCQRRSMSSKDYKQKSPACPGTLSRDPYPGTYPKTRIHGPYPGSHIIKKRHPP